MSNYKFINMNKFEKIRVDITKNFIKLIFNLQI